MLCTTNTLPNNVKQFRKISGISGAQSYVLVQVRQNQNKSNVDALIDKVVPPKKFEEIADTARKQFKNFKQFTIKNKANDKELDSIVFAIKTDEQNVGRRQDGGRYHRGWQDGGQQNGNEILTYLFRKFLSFFESPGQRNLSHYKAQLQKYHISKLVLGYLARLFSHNMLKYSSCSGRTTVSVSCLSAQRFYDTIKTENVLLGFIK